MGAKHCIYLLSVLSALAGCADRTDDGLKIEFEGRTIDIAPFFREFPYSYFNVSKEGDKLLFFKSGTEQRVQMIDIGKGADIRDATDVSNLDFSKRNCWNPYYNRADGYFYWQGDESNDEIINLYRTKPGSNEHEKLTDVPYIYEAGFSPDGTKFAYVGRMGQNEDRLDELHILDLVSLDDILVCEDDADFRYTWGGICWHPEGRGLVLLALKGMDRTYTNVLYIDLATGKSTVLTDPSKRGSLSGTGVLAQWYDSDKVFFLSDQDGYSNLYRYSLSSGKTSQFTEYKDDIAGAGFLESGGKKYIFAVQGNPIGSNMLVLDPETGATAFSQPSPLALDLGTTVGDAAIMTAGGTTAPFQLIKATVSGSGIATEVLMDTPADIREKLVHSTVERLQIPTFDIDPLTGKTRMIHAYLYKPEHPLPADKGILLVESFYGGHNSYSAEYQIYAQAGMYILSASPRGSSGFGRDFEAMNDKDLGGNETIDMIYVSKAVSDSLGIPPERVGVFGMSHGGYETMRLMTFPGEVNGHQAAFPFGFGMESAGFCNINWLFYNTNIPDWITLEAGNPSTDSVKLAERSPINHADRITGPLLLLHGTNDNRVGFGGSQAMAAKLEELGKPYRFVVFEGQGHGYKGIENKKKFYSASLGFIEEEILCKGE